MVTLTNRPGEYGAICLFEGLKIEGRDLQYHRACIPHCLAGSYIPFRWMGTLTVLAVGIFSS